ncbi:MAG: Snf7 family protein [Candidatus Hermodarchaeia archaeon]|jgi:division protein CdvB (Snf7/Vps24/ESCRT-III family)
MFRKLKTLFHKEALEDKIPLVIIKLESALSRLDTICDNLRKEDTELFERCIDARVKGDTIHAMMYANECAEIRKIVRLVISSRYALEQTVLRLHTVKKLGNIMLTVSPVIDVLKETKGRLSGIVPNVAQSLNDANRILVTSLSNMGTSTVENVRPLVYNEDAQKVLREAELAAEETIRKKFPKIPESNVEVFKEVEPLTT